MNQNTILVRIHLRLLEATVPQLKVIQLEQQSVIQILFHWQIN